MKINNNIQALNAYRNLNANQFQTSKNLERLSSGLRINRAADDAAGLAISEKMRAQIRGLKMAERNSMDGISMIQTAEGALAEVHAMLQRMRELAVQAANDTNTETDRKEIQKEINQLTSEINRIGNATEFNTKKLLNGGATKIAPAVIKEGTAISTGRLTTEVLVESIKGVNFNPEVVTGSVEAVTAEIESHTFAGINNVTASINKGSSALNDFVIEFLDTGNAPDPAEVEISSGKILVKVGADNTGDVDTWAKINDLINSKIIADNGAIVPDDLEITIGGDAEPTVFSDLFKTAGNELSMQFNNAGIDEQRGVYSFTLTEDFLAELLPSDTITIAGVTFTAVTGTADASSGQFQIGTIAATLTSLQAAINHTNAGLTGVGEQFAGGVAINGNTITLTEAAGQATGIALNDTNVKANEQLGSANLRLEKMFVRGEKFTIGGFTLTAFSAGANPTLGQFNVGNTREEQANNIKAAIDNHPDLMDRFTVNVTNNVISIVEKPGQATGESLTPVNTGNATGTIFFDHQAKSREGVAAVWNTGAISALGDGNTGTFVFNGITVNLNTGTATGPTVNAAGKSVSVTLATGSTTDADTATAILAALNAYKDHASTTELNGFTFGGDENGIRITSPNMNAGSYNNLRVSTTGSVTIANPSNNDSQMEVRGITATASKYVFDITSAFKENETIMIGGFTFTGVIGSPDPDLKQFSVNGNEGDQAESLRRAIAATPELNNRYNIHLLGSKITLEEKVAGSEKSDNVAALTQPSTALTAAIPGEFSFKIERSIVGQSFTIDGYEIKIVNDSPTFNEEVNNGTAMRYHENLLEQARNLREAINRNPYLNARYAVDGTGENIILRQREGQESAELPKVMLGNTGTGDTFRSQLQIGPNQSQTLTFELNDMRSPMLGLSTTDLRTEIRDNNGDLIVGAEWSVVREVSNGISDNMVEFAIDITSHEKATAAISVFDAAIERVNAQRASLGAFQNRLEHTINNLQVTQENLTASESRIRDADMALEMTEFTRNNILNQSATAMLAQANQLPQGVLQLLQ